MRSIGGLVIDNPFIAAPLAGVTDGPTRAICRQMGAAMVSTEMISCKGLIFDNKKTTEMLEISEEEKPVSIQIFGSEPEIMAEAVRQINSCNHDVLDINMGCPVPKVVKNGEGAALMKNPALVYEIVSAVVEASTRPVTAKIRTGWDSSSVNCVEVAQQIEKAGAAAVTVHGRTRKQYYSGSADWNAIKQVVDAVEIPVIGNGDVFSGDDAVRMMKETSCEYVMIGRGMLGNPWIFQEALAAWRGEEKPQLPSREEVSTMMRRHLIALIENKGERRAVLEMRKHLGWYTKGYPGSAEFRRQTNNCLTENEMLNLIDAFKEER